MDLAIWASLQMVDVGCGLGGSSRHLANKYGCTAKGITLSPYQVKRGNEISRSKNLAYVPVCNRRKYTDGCLSQSLA